MNTNTFLLYGANGYTGELIARFASQYGLQPLLAGRRREAIEPLAVKLGLSFRVIDLQDAAALQAALREVPLVVHAAGPYDITAQPMMAACLETGTHYLDLNGDTDVFEALQAFDTQAKAKNIMIMPGAGFDVIPTDCLAMRLKNRMPDATALKIAFVITGSALSRGTSITTLQKLGLPGAVRINGHLVPEPVGKRSMQVAFPGYAKKFLVMSIPWGDLSTAFFSTRIPSIETYTGINRATFLFLKGQRAFNWLLRSKPVRSIIQSIINRLPAGPGDAKRDKAVSLVWAEVTNKEGKRLSATLRCPEAYSLTALGILLISRKILDGHYTPGYQTPASAYGENLVLEIPGVYLT